MSENTIANEGLVTDETAVEAPVAEGLSTTRKKGTGKRGRKVDPEPRKVFCIANQYRSGAAYVADVQFNGTDGKRRIAAVRITVDDGGNLAFEVAPIN